MRVRYCCEQVGSERSDAALTRQVATNKSNLADSRRFVHEAFCCGASTGDGASKVRSHNASFGRSREGSSKQFGIHDDFLTAIPQITERAESIHETRDDFA
jgi:hypothetical protein